MGPYPGAPTPNYTSRLPAPPLLTRSGRASRAAAGVRKWEASTAEFEKQACACCVQPFGWLRTPEGRLRLLRRYNLLLRTAGGLKGPSTRSEDSHPSALLDHI